MKISVFISEDLLREVDQAAREAGTTRNACLIQAVRQYLEHKGERRQKETRRQAALRMNAIAEQIGPWDATSEVLKWRDKH